MAKSFILRMLVVGCLFTLPACRVSYTVISHGDTDMPAQAHHLTHSKTHWAYLCGLVSKNDPQPAGCEMGSNISRARVSTNAGFILITGITLGIVVPQRIEWDCSQVVRSVGPSIGN